MFTIQQIADFLGATIEGDATIVLSNLAKIEEAKQGDLCFLANLKYLHYLFNSQASAVIINRNLVLEQPVRPVLIRVDDAYAAFGQLLNWYQAQQKTSIETREVHPAAIVSETATLGENVSVGAGCYIGKDAVIGKNTVIYPQCFIGDKVILGENTIIYAGVKIYENCIVGSQCIIHSGVVIGADGFGFAPMPDGSYKKIAQTGNVLIENDVEIGANTCIDRATLGSTIIRKGVKLDNLIQIAHNVEIGAHTVIAAQTGVAGSTKIGKNCMIGGQVGFVGHIKIADGTQINAQSGIAKSVEQPGQALSGSPAFAYKDHLKASIAFKQLPSLVERLRQLENKLLDMEH